MNIEVYPAESFIIFADINSDKYTDLQKAKAIFNVLKIAEADAEESQDTRLEVIRWLFDQLFDVQKEPAVAGRKEGRHNISHMKPKPKSKPRFAWNTLSKNSC